MCLFGERTPARGSGCDISLIQRPRRKGSEQMNEESRMPVAIFSHRFLCAAQENACSQYHSNPTSPPKDYIIGPVSEKGNKLFGVVDKFRSLRMRDQQKV